MPNVLILSALRNIANSLGLRGVLFFIPWARVGECRPETSDPENGRRLWEWLENETRDF